MIVQCANCAHSFDILEKRFNYYETHEGKGVHKYFCSRECLKAFKADGKTVKCKNCGKEIYKSNASLKRSKSGDNFCNKSCSNSFHNRQRLGENNPNYINGNSFYRSSAFEQLEHKCHFCNYDNEKVLQVHHIDEDRTNNNINNLLIVCPTHHWEIHLGVLTDISNN